MSEYIVSARKYRPDSFDSLIGQDNIVQTLKNSIKRGQLAHAYLFCGPRGVGKTSAARVFAKTINCENPSDDLQPCGKCESCVSFQEGRSYCIHELDAASNNSVEDIKSLIDQVNVPPQVGKYSVFIVDEVHMLSQAAFNAFLKTLEEPPAHAIFILATTEKHKVLPTIMSRCQTYDFNRIGIADMVRNMRMIAEKEGVKIDDESLHVIALKADGAMRDALTIFDQTVAFCGTDVHYEAVLKNLGVLGYDYCFSLVDAFLSGDYKTALTILDEILSKGFNALYFVSSLSSHLRDLMVARTDGMDSLLELPDSLKKRYQEQAARCPLQFLYDALGISVSCESAYKGSVNPRLHIEYALMRICWLTRDSAQQPTSSQPAPSQTAPSQPPKPQFAAPAREASRQTATAEPPVAPTSESRPSAAKTESQPQAQPSATNAPQQPAADQSQEASKQPVKPQFAAPALEAQPPKPATRRRPTPPAKASALSIASMTSTGNVADPVVEKEADDAPLPSDDAVLEGWKKVPQKYESRPRLFATLSSPKVSVTEVDGKKVLTFNVMNEMQKKWLEEGLLRELESDLRGFVGSSKVRLLVAVISDEKVEEKPYMPEEQAMELIKTNPEVKNLVQDFGLDTK